MIHPLISFQQVGNKETFFTFTGIYYTMAIIGPAVGYVVGGQLLLIYTDFMTVDSNT